MRKTTIFLLTWILAGAALASPTDPAVEKILNRYFEAAGGPDAFAKLKNLSFKADSEAIQLSMNACLNADGRYRIEGGPTVGTVVYDGSKYWQSYFGLVQELDPALVEQFSDMSFYDTMYHGIVGSDGHPVALRPAGTEERQGRVYDVLAGDPEKGTQRKFLFDPGTGLLDRVIDTVEDPEYRQRVIVRKFSAYEPVGPFKIATGSVAQCITTGELLQPDLKMTDLKADVATDGKLFVKPEAAAGAPRIENGVLHAKVLSVSGRGSVITNVTRDDVKKLDVKPDSLLKVTIKDKTFQHRFVENLQADPNVKSGDYIAVFNQTPALWIVKAYVGMTSEVQAAAGDPIAIALETKKDTPTQQEENHGR